MSYILKSSVVSNITAPVVFGCGTTKGGGLTKQHGAVDGFAQQELSVVSQLFAQSIIPESFSHCLKGGDSGGGGGGILVFGDIVEPNLVYTPLVPPQTLYYVDLLNIAVSGQSLPINPSVYSTSSNHTTIIDSGTTLTYLTEEIYDPVVNAITQAASQSVRPFHYNGSQCYFISSSVSHIFPMVTLNFIGGSSMILKPEDYLLPRRSKDGAKARCLGFLKTRYRDVTILGDLVLKDKIVVYDIGGQRIGWANYDCSLSINVSTNPSSGASNYVYARHIGGSSSRRDAFIELIPISIVVFLLHISLFRGFPVM